MTKRRKADAEMQLLGRLLLGVLLCVLSQCRPPVVGCHVSSRNVEIVGSLFDAENIVFTRPHGRLIVTGGDNVYEVIVNKRDGSFAKNKLFPVDVYFLGIVQLGDFLYTVDERGNLYAAKVEQLEPLQFRHIYTIQNVSLPNGMAADVDSMQHIFVADTALLKRTGKLIRLTIKPNHATVSEQVTWLEKPFISHPNGLRYWNHSLYLTDTTRVVVVPIVRTTGAPDTRNMMTLFSKTTVLDDMNFVSVNNTLYLVVANYLQSSLIFLNPQNGHIIHETSYFHFQAPSSLAQGQPPLFPINQLVVTNKGIVRSKLGWGNTVSVVDIENC